LHCSFYEYYSSIIVITTITIVIHCHCDCCCCYHHHYCCHHYCNYYSCRTVVRNTDGCFVNGPSNQSGQVGKPPVPDMAEVFAAPHNNDNNNNNNNNWLPDVAEISSPDRHRSLADAQRRERIRVPAPHNQEAKFSKSQKVAGSRPGISPSLFHARPFFVVLTGIMGKRDMHSE
jgi:hypothetical protein